ncbi:MAG TPA: hypothetical protein VM680_14005 [Verrucomicrobiae bacterium]|nr:hypothetical protein [Verrucomicrobiae bacterium]
MAPLHPVAEILRDITSPRKRPWILVLLGLFLVCAAWKTKLGAPRELERPSDTIEYHYNEWRRHVTALNRAPARSRFSVNALLSRLEPKTSPRERREKINEHELALMRLGYFSDFNFDPKDADYSKLMLQFYTNTLNADLHIYFPTAIATFGDHTNIHITARNDDIPKLEAIFKQLASAQTNR